MPSKKSADLGRPRLSSEPNGRQRLLEAAKVEFGTHGYAPTTVDQLVARANVNPPTLYHHFDGKAGLFVAIARDVYTAVLDSLRESVQDLLDLPKNSSDTFERILDSIFSTAVILAREDFARAKLFTVIQFEIPRQPEIGSELKILLREFDRFFLSLTAYAPKELARSERERRHLSRALVSMYAGLNAEMQLLSRPSEIEHIVERVKALLRLN